MWTIRKCDNMEKTHTKFSEYKAHLGKLLQSKEHSINVAKEEERQQMKGNYRKHNYGKYALRTHHICVCVCVLDAFTE
jgi:hypothetical protein